MKNDKKDLKLLFVNVSLRPGGYTRIIKTGFRLGDNAEMSIIELVDYNTLLLGGDESDKTTKSRRRRRKKTKAEVGSGEEPKSTKKEKKVDKKDSKDSKDKKSK